MTQRRCRGTLRSKNQKKPPSVDSAAYSRFVTVNSWLISMN